MKAELLHAFDVLMPHCDVSAALCDAAGQGALDAPLDVHSICTRIGLPQARAVAVERTLIRGLTCNLFTQSTPHKWQVGNRALALELAPFLHGARLYRIHVSKSAGQQFQPRMQHEVLTDVVAPSYSDIDTESENTNELDLPLTRNSIGQSQHLMDAAEVRRRTVVKVREDLPALAAEHPLILMALHADIERVSLQQMIDSYRDMLVQQLSENIWQKFFDQNIFILTMLFCGPVHLVSGQFHAQPSGIRGTGAQIGDYLFRGAGQVLSIVEIKKPATSLVQKREYRSGGGVHAPDSELSGAVSQVLYQRHSLQTAWGSHRDDEVLAGTRPDNTRCVVIAGTLPIESKLLRSFETFRWSYKDVEIITFDELLRKLEFFLTHLAAE